MKVINLFGAPGAGKSTCAAGLFHEMKSRGYEVELVTEFAKDLTWARRQNELRDQLYILAKQNHRMEILKQQVDFVITDSPLLLSLIYTPENYHKSFKPFVIELFKSYDNFNVFLHRVKKYNPKGRNQTKEESDEIAKRVLNVLKYNNCELIEMNGSKDAPLELLEDLESIIY